MLEIISSLLLNEGMNLLSNTVKAGGEKAVDFIEKKTGVDIKDAADPATETKLLPEHVEKLKALEKSKVLDLAKIIAGADKGKAGGILLASIASEVPEMILFGMGLVMILGFAVAEILKTGEIAVATNLGSAWMGSFAMYVKGK